MTYILRIYFFPNIWGKKWFAKHLAIVFQEAYVSQWVCAICVYSICVLVCVHRFYENFITNTWTKIFQSQPRILLWPTYHSKCTIINLFFPNMQGRKIYANHLSVCGVMVRGLCVDVCWWTRVRGQRKETQASNTWKLRGQHKEIQDSIR